MHFIENAVRIEKSEKKKSKDVETWERRNRQ